ncbi:DUF3429 domain-containing protein [Rhodalgimonas zhirmunskyi]|uniref:DUF3429 domain-containing protein n=1 Tax=Rhodalgimonas zhirmunskyi TaxID=2964767 RepID=A0AAJ1UC70_9RHOB|nr:DUF3429 domain-containing protein [Rhodoalgimonas zhirmunskyi]MDQ2095835.1 DUF3429 domain-containing protein [Rhodoalgimonas zhirmunskyi]
MDRTRTIPRHALWLGAAGLLPFVWGALTTLAPDLGDRARDIVGPRMVGPYVQLFYGMVILSFMSGVLWGFTAKSDGRHARWAYAASTLPALWVFFTTGGGVDRASWALIAGFAGLLALDRAYWKAGLAPDWWMALRVPLTLIVILCLLTGAEFP